jgi:hypothetical protein
MITSLRPDLVIGEATLFHELITASLCKQTDILYVNPSTCRYPTGRFSFYLYDTLVPKGGSEENWADDFVDKVIEQISFRHTKPDYMKVASKRMARINSRLRVYLSQIKPSISYICGEKFNSPSLKTKWHLSKNLKSSKRLWQKICSSNLLREDSGLNILYPLQMQPEANLDVWGNKYRDQVDLILKISNILPENCKLLVKANPKAKYEVSSDLVDLINSRKNITALPIEMSMDEALKVTDLVITVTGTIAIECSFSKMPVITLVDTIHNINVWSDAKTSPLG